jgi:glutamate dehydrogenase
MSRLVWFIRNVDFSGGSLDQTVAVYRSGIQEIEAGLDRALFGQTRESWQMRSAALVERGVPADLAPRVAALQDLVAAPDIVLVAQRTGRPVSETAATHFAVGDIFQLGALSGAARDIPVGDYFDRLALDRTIDAIAAAHRKLTAEVAGQAQPGPEAVAAWSKARGVEIGRIRAAVDSIVASGLSLSKLTVAASLLGDLAKG